MNEQAPSKELVEQVLSENPYPAYSYVPQNCIVECERATRYARSMMLETLRRSTHEPRVLPEVGGNTLPTTLAQFELRAKHFLADEQQKPSPDNALIGFLCDAVRLARENERMAKTGLGPPPAPDLKRISDARLEWSMVCECTCSACTTFDQAIRSALTKGEGDAG